MILDDTIVAVSSPPGRAARGIVRLTGPEARSIAARVFTPTRGQGFDGLAINHCVDGAVAVGPARLPARAWVFLSPRSYTRQDVVELHLLGAPAVLGLLVEALMAAGARRAEPGAFTARAFLAGAMDLSQAHGVAALIAARTDEQMRAAERLLHGALSRTALEAREQLADLLALVEGALDFADEPIEFIAPAELSRRLHAVRDALEAAAGAGLRSERWGRMPQVVLLGIPNAGKSSLLNVLTGQDRTLCSPVAGTTRDVILAPLTIGDLECLLVDGAGIEPPATDFEFAAQSATARAARHADVIVAVLDLAAAFGPAADDDVARPQLHVLDRLLGEISGDESGGMPPMIVALNKSDLASPQVISAARRTIVGWRAIESVRPTSAATGAGCDALKRAIARALLRRPSDVGDAIIALTSEHHEALQAALLAMENAIALADAAGATLLDAELVALELHAAADQLGVLTGRDLPDDLLGRIFARFCIGK